MEHSPVNWNPSSQLVLESVFVDYNSTDLFRQIVEQVESGLRIRTLNIGITENELLSSCKKECKVRELKCNIAPEGKGGVEKVVIWREDIPADFEQLLLKLTAANSEKKSRTDLVTHQSTTIHSRLNTVLFSLFRQIFLTNLPYKFERSFYEQFENNLYLKTEDGNSIGAFLYTPEKITENTLFFVICHGKGTERSEISSVAKLEKYVESGVCFLVIDYRDFGDSTGEYTMEGANLDVLAAIQFMKTKFRCSSVFLLGHSFGAAVAIEYGRYAATERPEALPSRIYALAPFSTTVNISRDFLLFRVVSFFIFWLQSIIRKSFHYDSLESAKPISSRLVVIHGANDELVNIRHGEMIARETGCVFKNTEDDHDGVLINADTWKYVFEDARKFYKK